MVVVEVVDVELVELLQQEVVVVVELVDVEIFQQLLQLEVQT